MAACDDEGNMVGKNPGEASLYEKLEDKLMINKPKRKYVRSRTRTSKV